MRLIPVLVASLAVAGCADNPASPAASGTRVAAAAPADPASAPRQVCHRELPTGSNIPTTVCEPVQTEAERLQRVQDIQNQVRQQTTPRAPGGG
jgi:hypothetical protein